MHSLLGFFVVAVLAAPAQTVGVQRPNLLLITADDLNCDSVGAFGSTVAGTTPNIDRLAKEGMRFTRAHVTIAVCQPCRAVWMTGRYPHRSGGHGFHKLTKKNVPILPGLLREAGYRVGILGKVKHSTPYASFRWDYAYDQKDLGQGRNPKLYAERAGKFFKGAAQAKRPFFLMANSHDPHRPFNGNDRKIVYAKGEGAARPSRGFSPEEIKVPGFLADLPAVRREIAEYMSSVRRCDDTVGALLGALEDSGLAESTVVVFLSDHGMALPFAKTNCYLHSTRTPLIVRWPERVKAGEEDRDHFVAGIDLLPTLLEIAGVAVPEGIDGTTFATLLKGEKEPGRDAVFTQFHATSGARAYPMRAVVTERYLYVFNTWADGKTVFRNESQNGRTMRAMRAAASTDSRIRGRVDLFLHRTVEELYDLERDPDALDNLAGREQHAQAQMRMRDRLRKWMRQTEDPALAAFDRRDSPEALAAFTRSESEAARRRRPARRRGPKARGKKD
ncbi:MAG: sulfatase [Planctomycetota bacterium]|jgi:N-sulfoglucosamine sulfohydrolase|nr:sulfatase [Planctomycetota bacterium]